MLNVTSSKIEFGLLAAIRKARRSLDIYKKKKNYGYKCVLFMCLILCKLGLLCQYAPWGHLISHHSLSFPNQISHLIYLMHCIYFFDLAAVAETVAPFAKSVRFHTP